MRDPIDRLRSNLYLGARLLGNVQAVRRGHVLQRLARIAVWRFLGRIVNRRHF